MTNIISITSTPTTNRSGAVHFNVLVTQRTSDGGQTDPSSENGVVYVSS